jgi:hypothetical protein
MTVQQLIVELQKCNPNDIVMYDCETELLNDKDGDGIYGNALDEMKEFSMSVDDVLIGSGTSKGFVYLSAEKIE